MTNEYNLKEGDRVRHVVFNLCGIITDFLGGGFVEVKAVDNEAFSTWDINNLELCDRRTDFLRRLGALLREFDASFEFYDVYDMEIRIGEESVEYGFLNKENSPSLTADNIMKFEKE